MGDYQAPQWIDFIQTCSPQPSTPDFFETVHAMHERVLSDSVAENTEPDSQPVESQTDVPSVNVKVQEDLNIIKSTPVKVVSPKHRNNKETTVAQTTYEQVLNDAMKKLELCRKPLKASRDASNKTTQQPDAFKTPTMPLVKSSRSVGYRSIPSKCTRLGQNSVPRAVKVIRHIDTPIKDSDTSVNVKKTSVSCSLFKADKEHVETFDTSKRLNDPGDNPKSDEKDNEEHKEEDDNKEDQKECNEENAEAIQDEPVEQTNDDKDNEECGQDDVEAKIKKNNQTQCSKRSTVVLTWQNRRRSLHKRRSVSANNVSQYVSLAEAVSRFQTETPKRFRSRSTRENHADTTMNVSKLMQNRLKPTIPISPALVSKNRTRAVTVLSQEEREKLQMEELKKHPIKANPIPRSVLHSPRIKVTGLKKPAPVGTNSFSSSTTQINEKSCAASAMQPKHMSLQRDKAMSVTDLKKKVTKVLVTDPSGIIVDHEEITFFGIPKDTGGSKSVTRVVPFSFEARNRDMLMKKEQRLKNLQEAKTKLEFHARPAPNFSKPPTLSAKQQQPQQKQQKSRIVLPSPFSFEERDKKVPKKKEQLVKQVLDEDKRARVFRANPVPVFKPVMVRGRSREHLSIRDRNTTVNEHADKESENQENREPNVDPLTTENGSSNANKAPLMEKREGKALPIELNTDKRAKERREFDEKMRRKEMEEGMKREEDCKQREQQEKLIKAELRKLTEVRARPMPVYKPLVIEKATKPLTTPQSPAFASKLRMKQV